ncbi:glycosyltransferase family 4 protein [Candidatus Falkowbacteria bacterium]|nr:glycosyltransferase family 4 protein [Candidatus Falkowbacteria bacterium]
MKIILLTTKLNFKTGGGSVTDIHLKAKGLAELGHDVSVVTTRSAANTIDEKLPYAVYEENIDADNFIKLQYGAYKLIKKYEAKAEVFYIDFNFLYGGGAYKLFGGKKFLAVFFNMRLNCWHDPEVKMENFFARAKRKSRFFLEYTIGNLLVNKIEAFIYNTPMLADIYYDFGYKKEKGHIVEDMVNTSEIIKERQISPETIKAKQTGQDKIIIYCSGRLLKEKGFDLVIQAVGLLKNKDKFQVIIGGTGPDEERLRKMTQDLNLEKYIIFPGWLEKEKMHENLSKSHIFVFPKWWVEYGSVVLTEAMSMGLPCLVPSGGALEWLSAGASLPFQSDNYKDLAEKIEQLGASADLRIELALGGLKRAEELDYKKLVVKLEKAIKSAVNNKIIIQG